MQKTARCRNLNDMKPTTFILLLPLATAFCLVSATSHRLNHILVPLWIASSIFCFIWGFYISRHSRLLGWLCLLVALAQLAFIAMSAVSR
jgi:hypothetical protein